MTRYVPPLLLTGLCVWLAGCSIIGEERLHYMKKDWDRIKGPVWSESAEKLGFNDAVTTPKSRELANEKAICGHPNSQNRIVVQDGVSDSYGYRRCPLAPYDMSGGSRMGVRPDGIGTVVKQ